MEKIQIIWAVLIVVFLLVEAATAGLTSIWFALGAAAALILSLIAPDTVIWQTALFIVVSAVTLVLTHPIAKKYVNSRVKATNADRVIGSTATVTQTIDNVAGTGEVSVSGRIWTARGGSEDVIEAGTLVKVQAISGVKLIVAPAEEKDTATV